VVCARRYNNGRAVSQRIFIAVEDAFPLPFFKTEKLIVIRALGIHCEYLYSGSAFPILSAAHTDAAMGLLLLNSVKKFAG